MTYPSVTMNEQQSNGKYRINHRFAKKELHDLIQIVFVCNTLKWNVWIFLWNFLFQINGFVDVKPIYLLWFNVIMLSICVQWTDVSMRLSISYSGNWYRLLINAQFILEGGEISCDFNDYLKLYHFPVMRTNYGVLKRWIAIGMDFVPIAMWMCDSNFKLSVLSS